METFNVNLLELSTNILLEIANEIDDQHTCSNDKYCIFESIQSCANANALIKIEDLDDRTLELNSSATIATNSFVENGFCFTLIDNSPNFQKGTVCTKIFATLTRAIKATGIEINYNAEEAERIVIENGTIKSKPDSEITGKVMCRLSLELKNLENIQKIQQLNIFPIWDALNNLFTIFNSKLLDKIVEEIEKCSGENFTIDNREKHLAPCIRDTLTKRSRRASIMSVLLGDGAEINSIESAVNKISGIVNKNSEAFLNNEKVLSINQNILDENIQKLEKGMIYNKLSRKALLHHISKNTAHQMVSNYNFVRQSLNLQELERVMDVLTKIMSILPNILLRNKNNNCINLALLNRIGCLDAEKSTAIIKNNGILEMQLTIESFKPQSAIQLSCLPDMNLMKISTLHDQLGIEDEENIILKEYIIAKRDLEDAETTNENTRNILNSDLQHQNVFVTRDGEDIALTCVNPEILISSNGNIEKAINCTKKSEWVTDIDKITNRKGNIKVLETDVERFSFDITKISLDLGNKETISANETRFQEITNIVLDGILAIDKPIFVSFSIGSVLLILCCVCPCICNLLHLFKDKCCSKKQQQVLQIQQEPPVQTDVRQTARRVIENFMAKLVSQQQEEQQ